MAGFCHRELGIGSVILLREYQAVFCHKITWNYSLIECNLGESEIACKQIFS